MPVNDLNIEDVNEIRGYLNAGDRGQAYYKYYELTGSVQFKPFQITTYMGPGEV